MLESIAVSLLQTLASYLFEQKLEDMGSIRVEGAPRWYGRPVDNAVCESGFVRGDLDSLDQVKGKVQIALVKRINGTVEAMIYDRFRNLKDPAEQDLVRSFARDEDLPVFVQGRVQWVNQDYQKKEQVAFARGCLESTPLMAYQQERMTKIRQAVVRKHSKDAFEELESRTGGRQ